MKFISAPAAITIIPARRIAGRQLFRRGVARFAAIPLYPHSGHALPAASPARSNPHAGHIGNASGGSIVSPTSTSLQSMSTESCLIARSCAAARSRSEARTITFTLSMMLGPSSMFAAPVNTRAWIPLSSNAAAIVLASNSVRVAVNTTS